MNIYLRDRLATCRDNNKIKKKIDFYFLKKKS